MGVMGAGFAKHVKQLYPDVYEQYRHACEEAVKPDAPPLLGTTLVIHSNDKYIANIMGQYDFGTNDRMIDYEALYTAFEQLRDWMIEHSIDSVDIPSGIGAGLAGGNSKIIHAMIDVVFEGLNVYLFELI
jgi:hypothetical protein